MIEGVDEPRENHEPFQFKKFIANLTNILFGLIVQSKGQ